MSKDPRSVPSAPLLHDQELGDEVSRVDQGDMSSAEAAQYIAEFTAELSYLPRRTRLDLLAYLLDMARLEAARAIQADNRKR